MKRLEAGGTDLDLELPNITPEDGDACDAGNGEQAWLQCPVGEGAQLAWRAPHGCQSRNDDRAGRRRERCDHGCTRGLRKLAGDLGQTFGDGLPRPIDVDAVREGRRDDGKSLNGLRANRGNPLDTVDRILEGPRDEDLDLLRREPRRLRLHAHLRRGELGKDVVLRPLQDETTVHEHSRRECEHDPAIPDREVDNGVQHERRADCLFPVFIAACRLRAELLRQELLRATGYGVIPRLERSHRHQITAGRGLVSEHPESHIAPRRALDIYPGERIPLDDGLVGDEERLRVRGIGSGGRRRTIGNRCHHWKTRTCARPPADKPIQVHGSPGQRIDLGTDPHECRRDTSSRSIRWRHGEGWRGDTQITPPDDARERRTVVSELQQLLSGLHQLPRLSAEACHRSGTRGHERLRVRDLSDDPSRTDRLSKGRPTRTDQPTRHRGANGGDARGVGDELSL